jgi:hypothetical protein
VFLRRPRCAQLRSNYQRPADPTAGAANQTPPAAWDQPSQEATASSDFIRVARADGEPPRPASNAVSACVLLLKTPPQQCCWDAPCLLEVHEWLGHAARLLFWLPHACRRVGSERRPLQPIARAADTAFVMSLLHIKTGGVVWTLLSPGYLKLKPDH